MERCGTNKAAERRFAPDARMVGKWYKAERGETINIFPEEPLRMKMSFSSSGHCNFTPNCVYADGDALCWEINDEYYRMVYRVRYEDGRLRGVDLIPAKYAEKQNTQCAYTTDAAAFWRM